MTDSTVTSDFFQSLDVQLDLSSQVTFYNLRCVDDLTDLLCQSDGLGVLHIVPNWGFPT